MRFFANLFSRPSDAGIHPHPVTEYDLPVELFKIRGKNAVMTLEHYRTQYAQTGLYPFLIGDAFQVQLLCDQEQDNTDTIDDILQYARELDPQQWMNQTRQMYFEDNGERFPEQEYLGEWPGVNSPVNELSIHKKVDRRQNILPEVYMGLAKVDQPWHLPAIVKFGAWNDCPEASVHCMLHQYWQAKYGAQIASLSGEMIECFVTHPPNTHEAALELAWEHFWYCQDIVDQGCETIENLAAILMNSRVWYFWWD